MGIVMSDKPVVVQGTLEPDGTLRLDERPALPGGRVRVTLEPLEPPAASGPDWWDVLAGIWKDQAARGHQPRTREQIDAELDAQRDEWEDRLRELDAIREEGRRGQEGP